MRWKRAGEPFFLFCYGNTALCSSDWEDEGFECDGFEKRTPHSGFLPRAL
jgi:hypothetical protein